MTRWHAGTLAGNLRWHASTLVRKPRWHADHVGTQARMKRDNFEKAKTFKNMFFASVFTKEADTLPEFHTPSENIIDLIFFTVDKVKKN